MAGKNGHHSSSFGATTINQDLEISETITRQPTEAPKTSVNKWVKYLNYQADWLEKTRGNLMIVATVIASMAFQAAMNPPTKDYDDDFQCKPNDLKEAIKNKSLLQARNAVISCINKYNGKAFIICNTISFSASFTIIFLLTVLPLRNKISLWVLLVTTSITLIFTSATYIVSISIAQGKWKHHERFCGDVVLYYLVFWAGLLLLLVVFLLLRLLSRLLLDVFHLIKNWTQKAFRLPARTHV